MKEKAGEGNRKRNRTKTRLVAFLLLALPGQLKQTAAVAVGRIAFYLYPIRWGAMKAACILIRLYFFVMT